MRSAVLSLCLVLLTGCSLGRVFQTKVPEPVSKSPQQTEAERSAADLIARKLETPVELKPVATNLSASLGAPKYSLADVSNFNIGSASAHANQNLLDGMLRMQRQLDALNKKLTTLQGKDIEGTGISLLGPGMATIVIGLIVLGVVFPPAFTLMGIAYRRLKQTSSIIVDQIDEAAKAPETADAMKKFKVAVGTKMDLAHKKVVSDLQKL